MEKDLVRAGYDAIAARYTAARNEQPVHPAQGDLLADLAARLPAGAPILDAGCGAGVPVTAWLSRRFAVTGIDISAEQVRLARRNVPAATFLCGDMTALDFPPGSFAAVTSFYAVIHVPREEHPGLLRSFHRLLLPGGYLLLCLGAGDWAGAVEEFFGAPMYWSHHDAATNLRLVTEVGFTVLREEIVPDGLDPATAANHLFVLARRAPDP